MKALILIYDSYAEFEVDLVGLFVKNKGEVVTVTDREDRGYATGAGGFKTLADVKLAEIDPSDYDALIIPGGNPLPLTENEAVLSLVRGFHAQGKVLAGICAGPVVLSAAGVLEGRPFTTSYSPLEGDAVDKFNWETFTGEDVTVDGNIVTGKGAAYVEFAVAVYKLLGGFDDDHDELETLNFFKNRHEKTPLS